MTAARPKAERARTPRNVVKCIVILVKEWKEMDVLGGRIQTMFEVSRVLGMIRHYQ